MTKKYRNIPYLLILSLTLCFIQRLAAQQVSVDYEARTDYITHYGGSASMSCNDAGGNNDEEYSSKRYSYDDVDTSPVSSGCQQCTTDNSSCNVSDKINLAQRTGSAASTLYFKWEAWEDDRGDRCSYDGPDNNFLTNDDDCYHNETASVQFRQGFGPSGPFTNSDYLWRYTPVYGSTNNHSLRFQYKWRYTGGEHRITPDCAEQSESFGTGKIFSWSVDLEAGKRYYFTTCKNGNTNNIVVLYNRNGYSWALDWSNACGYLTRVEYTPTVSGTYYLEVSKYGGNPDARLKRDPVTNAGRVYYGIVGANAALSINCPANITTDADPGACTAAVDYNDASASGGCGNLSINRISGLASGSDFPIGANTVTFQAEDENNRTRQCSFTVQVNDGEAPTARCQDVVIQLEDGSGASTTAAAVDDGSSDLCGTPELSLSRENFTCNDIGDNTVTLTVTDNSGNASTCTATVTVEGSVTPTALCRQDVVVQLDEAGFGSTTPADVDAGSDYSCDDFSLSLSQENFTCNDVGDKSLTLTIRGNDGAENTCTANVKIEDNTAPSALCLDATVQLDASGLGSLSTGDIDNGSSDACSGLSLMLSKTNFDCDDVGDNTVTLSVLDNSGNTNSCDATVTVEDNVAPTARCKDAAVRLDVTGGAVLEPQEADNGSTDACGSPNIWLSRNLFRCEDIGTKTTTLIVADAAGNMSTCTVNVLVEDQLAPVLTCQDANIQLDDSGNASIAPSAVENYSFDACGIAFFELDQTDFTCADLGANTITLTATDIYDNSSSCTATVAVKDATPPVARCRDASVQLDGAGLVSVSSGLIDNGSYDLCGGVFLPKNIGNFNCSNIGANTVTLRVTDKSGNTNTCDATVTVEDNVAPVASCRNLSVQLDENGDGSITAADVDAGSSDACGIASMSLSRRNFDCGDVAILGDKIITLTLTDNNGNQSTCTASITVKESTTPVARCKDAVVQLDENGNGSIYYWNISDGSRAGCFEARYALDQQEFTCDDIGDNTVTMTVSYRLNLSNTASCEATVTVEDPIAPQINLAPKAKLWPPDYSYQTFTIEDMVVGIEDNCSQNGDLSAARILSVTSDEVEDYPGTQDGNTLNDIVIGNDCRSVQLRRERMGGGNGRVYTVVIALQGGRADYKVQVPQWAWGWNSEAVEDAAAYQVDSDCAIDPNAATIASQNPGTTIELPNGDSHSFKPDLRVYPNPFESETNIQLNLPEAGALKVEIFNIRGRRVRRLTSQNIHSGEHVLKWDGRDDGGQTLSSGLYLVRVQIGKETLVRKVNLQRM